MKTLVVVSALVALTIAAPAQPGDGLAAQDWHPQALSALPDILKRDKKSPSEVTNPILNSGVSHSDIQNVHTDAGVSTPTGRSFTLKKPLIVKKKYGYQVYRDSEEEKAHADSNETCGRQVKVKLCDDAGNLRTTVKGSTHEGTHIHNTEDDVKHSIKMAKEAVENLQRDLKKMELKSNMKMAHESQSDIELHEDIEVARQALKHIHENFGNIESMSLHATSARDSEALHDVHLTIAKTEEERMAQWKEAVANIHKNVEIARNIEDSLKVASNQESLLHLDQSEAASTKTDKQIEEISQRHAALTEVDNMRLAQNTALETHHLDNNANEEKQLIQPTNDHLMEHNAREALNTEDDMKNAPSEMIQVNLDNIKSQDALISENHKVHEHEKSAEMKLQLHGQDENKDQVHKETNADHHHDEKSSELNMDMLTGQSEHHIMQVPVTKPVGEETHVQLDEGKAAFKTSEIMPDSHITSSSIMKPLTADAFDEHKGTDSKIEHHLEQQKDAEGTTTADDMIDFLAKSATQLKDDKKEKAELDKEHVMVLGKTAENLKAQMNEHVNENWAMKPKQAVHSSLTEIKHLDNMPKAAENIDFHNFAKHNENLMLSKSADHVALPDIQKQHMTQQAQLSHIETVPSMKAAEEHLHHLQHMNNGLLAHENRHLDHLSSMKAAEDFDKDFEMTHGQLHGHGLITEHTMDHLRNSHFAGHSQIPSKMGAHDFELASHVQPHLHHPARYHQNAMMHTPLHEMTGMGSAMHSNFHPSMRDAMEGFGSDHMFRWKPAHESARVAYGSGLSSSIGSTGAVGVFPNANTGGCAIPLLLSCSPSVVSGSLAKATSASAGPSSYGAPSYRTEEDFIFHNKRDVKNTNDVRTTNVMRTPTTLNKKTSIALENKL